MLPLPLLQARYISLQSYDSTRLPYVYTDCQFEAPARLSDYELFRDPGGANNPFRPVLDANATGAGACAAGGDASYTVTLTCAREGGPAACPRRVAGGGAPRPRLVPARAAPERARPPRPPRAQRRHAGPRPQYDAAGQG